MTEMTRFGCIVADPNWRYKNFSDTAHGAARAHYDGQSYRDISKIPVASWAADPCVLALWATWPKLPEAMAVLMGWGFHYVTGLPWVKMVPSSGEIRRGVGFWFQSASECVLIGTLGKPKRRAKLNPQIALLCGASQQFYAPIRGHSVKPEGIQDVLEARFSGPYLELFATRERPGWTCYGDALGTHLWAGGVAAVRVERDTELGEQRLGPVTRPGGTS